ncbi:MAG: hypothetical protein EOO11_07955 [Chitinophagaceae bacterium]|nr:MAG: hypothetical protein EOO11_07955 [Chitinophagaceae bacterium]
MRKLLLFFVLLCTGSAAFAEGIPPIFSTQEEFRWRKDNGNEATASWEAPAGTAISVPLGTATSQNLRLRIRVASSTITGSDITDKVGRQLYYMDAVSGTWTPISTDASKAFVLSTSPYVAGGTATTAQLSPGAFNPGVMLDAVAPTDSLTVSASPSATKYTEFEWVIRATSAAAPGTYTFQADAEMPAVWANGAPTLVIAEPVLTYAGSPYCGATGTASPTNSLAGGTYSAPAGLSIDPTSGDVDLAASTPGIYTVSYLFAGSTTTTQIAVRPQVASPTGMATVPNQVFCAGANSSIAFTSSIGGLSYNWINSNTAIGLAASGTNDVISFVPQNSGATLVSAQLNVQATGGTGCYFKPTAFHINVKPTPVLSKNKIFNGQTVCAGTATTPVVFTSSLPGSITWTNNIPSIGLAAMGSGNLPSFVAQSDVNAAQMATVTALAYADGCFSNAVTEQYQVFPAAGAIAYPQATYCASGRVFPTRTGGGGGGTWSANSGDLAIDPATGAIALYASQPGTYTVTYSVMDAGICAATATTNVTVLPRATVNPVPNITYCNNSVTAPVTFTGTASSYTWTNSNPAIGLAASGTGNLPSFTTTLPTPANTYALIKVTPQGDGAATCPGKDMVFRIQVNFCGVVADHGDTGGDGSTARTAFDRQVAASPNPTSGTVRVQYTGTATQLVVLVRDQFGTVLQPARRVSSNNIQVDLGSLRPGTYAIQLTDPATGLSVVRSIVKL